MPASLQLRLKKGSDGRVASFALHRDDGTFTVMRNPNPFFPIHDLTHYAVENTLRHKRGFYGLVRGVELRGLRHSLATRSTPG
jgi:hypothetical protein